MVFTKHSKLIFRHAIFLLLFCQFLCVDSIFSQEIKRIDQPKKTAPKTKMIRMSSGNISISALNCDTVHSFSLNDKWPLSIACDGMNIWGGGATAGWIYKYSRTGFILDSLPNPGNGSTASSMVFDGSTLWSLAEQEDLIFAIDTSTGQVLRKFHLPEFETDGFGLAVDGNDLIVSQYVSGVVYKVDKFTGSIVSQVRIPKPIGDIEMINGHLFGIDRSYEHIYEIDLTTGTFTDSVSWCIPYSTGFTWDGNSLWGLSSSLDNGGKQRAYHMRPGYSSEEQLSVSANDISIERPVNPAVQTITVHISPYLIDSRFVISDISGNIAYIGILNCESTLIDISQLSSGNYFFQVGDIGLPLMIINRK
ncbi:MAG TPA: T9SS type A sorting domain-containing protein [Bacteroidia bacterium]|jgi:hypothetical protein|nr:T9SS type A sorting domain-containing protein [Bacteroidia bacterium]